jgi:hypothetical protein
VFSMSAGDDLIVSCLKHSLRLLPPRLIPSSPPSPPPSHLRTLRSCFSVFLTVYNPSQDAAQVQEVSFTVFYPLPAPLTHSFNRSLQTHLLTLCYCCFLFLTVYN